MSISALSEPVKQAMDYSIAGVGFAFVLNLLPYLTGIAAFVLIILRIAIGCQEWRINRRKMRDAD